MAQIAAILGIYYHKRGGGSPGEYVESDNEILVSVVVPVYNSKEFLYPCLDSLFEQTLAGIEYIFVDDLGTDGSIELIKEYIRFNKVDRTVKFLRNAENSGPGPSRNAGIEAARGKYVGFVDPDDWVSPDFYELLYAAAALDPQNGTAYDVAKGIMMKVNNNVTRFSRHGTIAIANRTPRVYEQFTWQHFTGLFRRELLMEHPDARYGSMRAGEDLLFLLTAGFYANNITFAGNSKYYYRVRGDSLTYQNRVDFYTNDLESLKEMMDFFFKSTMPDQKSDEFAMYTVGKIDKVKKKLKKLYKNDRNKTYEEIMDEYQTIENLLLSYVNGTLIYP